MPVNVCLPQFFHVCRHLSQALESIYQQLVCLPAEVTDPVSAGMYGRNFALLNAGDGSVYNEELWVDDHIGHAYCKLLKDRSGINNLMNDL
ncbi:MAG: hypothetical protein HC767_00020 [Akkermansiaceae bacterium]|nr:hypothetical protein [Akkermansiaceae bacterium]